MQSGWQSAANEYVEQISVIVVQLTRQLH